MLILKKTGMTKLKRVKPGDRMDNIELNRSFSPEIKEFVSAFVRVQEKLKPAIFNKVNPHFKSRYADFSSCMDTCRVPLAENGIIVTQSCQTTNDKLYLVTMLIHTSGQWMKSEFPIISSKMDSQGIGSAMTYAKRYSLCGMIGIVADEDGDDDGEAAIGRGSKAEKKTSKVNEETVVESEAECLENFLKIFEKEDKHIAIEWLKAVQNHFGLTLINTIKDVLKDEKKLFEGFNKFKNKIKKTEVVPPV